MQPTGIGITQLNKWVGISIFTKLGCTDELGAKKQKRMGRPVKPTPDFKLIPHRTSPHILPMAMMAMNKDQKEAVSKTPFAPAMGIKLSGKRRLYKVSKRTACFLTDRVNLETGDLELGKKKEK
jgi:hypothetical protein